MPQYGTNTGTGQVLEKLVDLFKGHSFVELVIFKFGEEFKIENDKNITTISFVSGKSKLVPPIKFLKAIRQNKYSIDSLGIHMPFSPQNILTYFFSQVPIDYYPHGCFAPKTLSRRNKKTKKKFYFNFIEKRILKNARKIICATERESGYIKNLCFTTTTTVAHFPFTPPIIKKNFKLNFRHNKKISNADFLIVFVGRFDIHTKGLDILVKAIKIANTLNSSIKAALIGYNNDRPNELDNLIVDNKSENCVFNIGPLFGEDKHDALLSSNLYVQASRYESFGVSILEPLAFKIPCLLSDGCDISPSVYEAKGCYRFDGSIDNLVEEILSIYNNPNDTRVIGENGFNWIKDNLGAEALLETWEEVYKKSNR